MRYSVFVAPSGTTCASLADALGGVFTQPMAGRGLSVGRHRAAHFVFRRLSRLASRVHGARGRGNVRDVRRGIVSGVRVKGAGDARDVNRIERTRAGA